MIREIRGEKRPYILQQRRYGEGELRLGTYLELDESIYDYAYVLCISDKFMDQFIDILTGRLMDGSEDDKDKDNKVQKFLKKKALRDVQKYEKQRLRENTE